MAVFTDAQNQVVALDTRTGEVRWERELPLPARVRSIGLPPANVVGLHDLIIVPGWHLFALDRETGEIRWVLRRSDVFTAMGRAAVANGRVYSVGGKLFAVDPETGRELWSTDLGALPFAPIVEGGVIYLGTRGVIGDDTTGIVPLGAGPAVAVDAATGEVLWRFPIPNAPDTTWLGGATRPGVVANGLFIIAAENGRVYGLDRETGEPVWTHVGAAPYTGGVVVLDGMAVTANERVVGIDAATGELVWHTTPGSSVSDPLTKVGEEVVLVSVGSLYAYNSEGTRLWRYGGASNGGPILTTAATVHDGVAYFGSIEGFHAVRLPEKLQ